MNSLIVAYAITRQKTKRNTYSPIFSVQGRHGSKIDSKRSQIIVVETMMHSTYAIVSPNLGEESSAMPVF